MTHWPKQVQVCSSWRSCQGDRGHSQMGSVTHRATGRKHFGWVVRSEVRKEASVSQPTGQMMVNIDCGCHPGTNRQWISINFNVKDKPLSQSALQNRARVPVYQTKMPIWSPEFCTSVKESSLLFLRLQTLHEAQTGWRRREAGRGDGGRHPHHDLRVRGHVLQHAGAPLLLLWPPGYGRRTRITWCSSSSETLMHLSEKKTALWSDPVSYDHQINTVFIPITVGRWGLGLGGLLLHSLLFPPFSPF